MRAAKAFVVKAMRIRELKKLTVSLDERMKISSVRRFVSKVLRDAQRLHNFWYLDFRQSELEIALRSAKSSMPLKGERDYR